MCSHLHQWFMVVLTFFSFIANEYRGDINRDNPLGCEGQLAYSFAALVKKLWNGEHEYLYPKNLKVRTCVCVCYQILLFPPLFSHVAFGVQQVPQLSVSGAAGCPGVHVLLPRPPARGPQQSEEEASDRARGGQGEA